LLDFIRVAVVWLSDQAVGGIAMTFRSTATSAVHEITIAIRIVLFIFVVSLMSLPAPAQSTTGRVLGSVTDQSGAAVGGATVVVTDTQRGTSRTVVTDVSGSYIAPDLIPGTYKIHVEGKGFKTEERLSVRVEVASDVRADFTLQPGNVSEVVTVSAEIPLLNSTSATLGGTLSNEEINDLPLSGRNYENLLQLRPGVMRYPGGGFSTTSANGLRAEDNAYFVEGLFNSEPYSGQAIINGAGIAGDSATILPIDSIQEFNLQQNPPAEYGWKPGAVVNVGLKSGTNSIHGTAFGFGRDGALDARNYFNADPAAKLTRTLEQFGGSVGGPIIKDKAFFFAAYEGQRYNVGNSYGGVTSPTMVHITTPTNGTTCSFGFAGDCADSIPDAVADLQLGGIPLSTASQMISGCTISGSTVTCNGTGFPTNNTQGIAITNGFNNDVHINNFVGKGDYKLSTRSSISGMYFFGNNSGNVEDFPELQTKWLSTIHTRAQVVGGSWIWTPSARLVNEARVGYNRLYQPTLPDDLNTPASSYGLDTGVSGPNTGGLPRIGFGGYFFPGLGGFKWPKFQGPDSITQFVDHISYTAGKHALKFGGELHYNKVTNASYGNARGSVNFLGGVVSATPGPAGSSPLEDFFAGAPFKSTVEVGNPTLHLHNWAYSLFFHDDFRATRNLTINFGVRYEFSSVPQEANNLLGNFDPNVGLVQVGHQISSLYNPDHTNFGPRFGFAWDIGGNGKTVLRGGGGLIYETVNWQSFIAFNNAFGPGSVPTGAPIDAAGDTSGGTITTSNVTVKNFLNYPPTNWDAANGPLYGGSTVDCSPVQPSGNPGSPCPIMTVDRNLTTPYVWNWTLNVQHAFTPNLSLEAAYVGNHGSNLTGIRDINQPPVGSDYNPVCADAFLNSPDQFCLPFNSKFPYLSNIFQMGNVYRSNYNGLQVTLNARNYRGLSMVAGYTYSHASDDVGANWDFGYGSGLPQNAHNVAAEYANSDFDIRHRLTVSLTYAIPGRKGFGQMREGWELNSIITLQTPQFWGPMDEGTDAAGVGPLPVSPPANSPIRWSFYRSGTNSLGNPADFKSRRGVGIPYFAPTNPLPAGCVASALAEDGGVAGAETASLNSFGCYAAGNSVMMAPPLGQFGNMGRNMFQDTGFKNFDFSVGKNFHLGEAMRLQFRAEFFNILNHPNFANPYGGQNGFGLNDPSVRPFGCGCATPDIAAANPAVGSGGPRSVQLGAKFTF
jgi:hypothetical protein